MLQNVLRPVDGGVVPLHSLVPPTSNSSGSPREKGHGQSYPPLAVPPLTFINHLTHQHPFPSYQLTFETGTCIYVISNGMTIIIIVLSFLTIIVLYIVLLKYCVPNFPCGD